MGAAIFVTFTYPVFCWPVLWLWNCLPPLMQQKWILYAPRFLFGFFLRPLFLAPSTVLTSCFHNSRKFWLWFWTASSSAPSVANLSRTFMTQNANDRSRSTPGTVEEERRVMQQRPNNTLGKTRTRGRLLISLIWCFLVSAFILSFSSPVHRPACQAEKRFRPTRPDCT